MKLKMEQNMKKLLILVLMTLPLYSGCSNKQNDSTIGPDNKPGLTLASVGNKKIKLNQFDTMYRKATAGRPLGSVSKESFLAELVRIQLGALEAEKEEIDQDTLIGFQINATLTQALLEKHLGAQLRAISVSDDEAKEYFEKNPQIRASHILILVPPNADQKTQDDAKLKADDIYKQALANKKSFPDLAKKYSQDPTGKKGGDLGYFSKNTSVPELSDTAFALKEIGDISPPTKTQFGWHIVQLTAKRNYKDEDKNLLKQNIIAEKRAKVVNDYFASLEKKYSTTVYNDRLGVPKAASPTQSK